MCQVDTLEVILIIVFPRVSSVREHLGFDLLFHALYLFEAML